MNALRPFFLRALLVTVVLMPLAHCGRLSLRAASRRRDENTQVWVVIGVIGFVGIATLATFLSAALFHRPGVELAALTVALSVSQLLYRRHLSVFYRTADLA